MTSLGWTHWPLKSSRCLCHQTPPIKPGLWLNVKRINRLRAGVDARRTCINMAVLFPLLLMLHIHTELHKEPGTRSIHSLACGTGLFNVLEDGNLSRSVSLNCVNSQAPEQEKKPIRGKHQIRCPSELTRECWESQFHSCCKECYLASPRFSFPVHKRWQRARNWMRLYTQPGDNRLAHHDGGRW